MLPRREGGEVMSIEQINLRKREAYALIRKGGLSAKIGLAFLKSHGAA